MNKEFLEQIEAQLGIMTKDEIDNFSAVLKKKVRDAKKANSATALRKAALDGRLLNKLIGERGEFVINAQILTTERDAYLTRNADRVLFGLPPLPGLAGSIAPKRRGRPKKTESSKTKDESDTADTPDAADLPEAQFASKALPEVDDDVARPHEVMPEFSPSLDRDGTEAVDAHSPDDDPKIDEKWKTFPHLPGSPRKYGGTWLGIKKDQKERPKTLGALWDAQEKQWCAPEVIEFWLFLEWMPPGDRQPAD